MILWRAKPIGIGKRRMVVSQKLQVSVDREGLGVCFASRATSEPHVYSPEFAGCLRAFLLRLHVSYHIYACQNPPHVLIVSLRDVLGPLCHRTHKWSGWLAGAARLLDDGFSDSPTFAMCVPMTILIRSWRLAMTGGDWWWKPQGHRLQVTLSLIQRQASVCDAFCYIQVHQLAIFQKVATAALPPLDCTGLRRDDKTAAQRLAPALHSLHTLMGTTTGVPKCPIRLGILDCG